MSDPQHLQDLQKTKEKGLSLVLKLLILLFLVVISVLVLDIVSALSNWQLYVGFFLSCLGMFYIFWRVVSEAYLKGIRLRYLYCELPSRLSLVILLISAEIILLSTIFRAKGWETDSIMLVFVAFVIVLIPIKHTRSASILLVLSATYFFSGVFSHDPQSFLTTFIGGMFLAVLCLGFVLLIAQKPEVEAFLDWVEELQETRRESKEILHFLSETDRAKHISEVTKVTFEEFSNSQRPPPSLRKSVWDLEHEVDLSRQKRLDSNNVVRHELIKKFKHESIKKIREIQKDCSFANKKEQINIQFDNIEKLEIYLKSVKQQVEIVNGIVEVVNKLKDSTEQIKKDISHLKTTARFPASPFVSINRELEKALKQVNQMTQMHQKILQLDDISSLIVNIKQQLQQQTKGNALVEQSFKDIVEIIDKYFILEEGGQKISAHAESHREHRRELEEQHK